MSGDASSLTARLKARYLYGEVTLTRLALYLVLALFVMYFLAPIEAGLMTAFKTGPAIAGTAPYAPPGPSGFTLSKWETAIAVLLGGIVNSLVFAIPATILSATLGSLAAYGLTQIEWRGKLPFLFLFIAGIFIPYQAVLVPLSRFWAIYAPLEQWLAPVWQVPMVSPAYADLVELVVTHTAYGIPICTLLFRSYYKGMADDIIESARLDGASFARIYRRIVLPLSTPMFAVTLIYQFTQIWNDLLFALILVSSSSSPAAPVVLVLSGLGEALEGLDFALRMAGAFVAAIPTLVVYLLFGDEFAKGVST
ncbi:carbohydrate ABC transporter permease [Halomarina halobia]|uniref:Carbohydrate ABC transporter permease n=1 Tax=Halomarina halobia TaxID=3033386 RepID=A0ABD6A6L2_9EURY|nr:carbohydrate ABC transporter permease [Halomarina sp. PSR21]